MQAIKEKAHQLMIIVFHDKSWEITNSIIKLDFHSVEFIAVKKCFRCSDFDKKRKAEVLAGTFLETSVLFLSIWIA